MHSIQKKATKIEEKAKDEREKAEEKVKAEREQTEEEAKAEREAERKAREEAEREANIYRKLLANECKYKPNPCYNRCRLVTLFINSCILPIGIFLAFTTYDLHPLSCISNEGEEFIEYTKVNATTGTVEIQFPDSIKTYQKVAVALLVALGIAFLINVIYFYTSNFKIIEEYEKKVEEEVKKQ